MRRVPPRPAGLACWLRHIAIVACFTMLWLAGFEGLLSAAVFVSSGLVELSRPALCSDLPDDPGRASYAFADRIYTRFPVGTPWRELRGVLAEQGFAPVMPSPGRLNPGGRYVIEGVPHEIWCEVRWTSDASGHVTSVRPLYLRVAR